MSTTLAAATVNRYYQAINEGDWDAYEELFTSDAALEAPGGVTAVGPAGMRTFDQVFKTAASDFTVTTLSQVAAGAFVMSENVAEGTQTGALVSPSGVFPATGRRFGGKYVGVFELRDGRIAAQRIYYDRLALVEQLGMPEPGAVPSAVQATG